MPEESVPVKTIDAPGCHRRLATGGSTPPEGEIWPKSTRCTEAGAGPGTCRTTIDGSFPENWISKDTNGSDAMVTFVGAVRQSWNAAGSPTLTSGVQNTTLEATTEHEAYKCVYTGERTHRLRFTKFDDHWLRVRC